MMEYRLRVVLLAVAAALFACVSGIARADVKLPGVFTDHMVLHRGMAIPLWDSADPGEKVTVTLGGQSISVTAEKSGHWKLDLASLAAAGVE